MWAPRARSTSSTARRSWPRPTRRPARARFVEEYKAKFASPYEGRGSLRLHRRGCGSTPACSASAPRPAPSSCSATSATRTPPRSTATSRCGNAPHPTSDGRAVNAGREGAKVANKGCRGFDVRVGDGFAQVVAARAVPSPPTGAVQGRGTGDDEGDLAPMKARRAARGSRVTGDVGDSPRRLRLPGEKPETYGSLAATIRKTGYSVRWVRQRSWRSSCRCSSNSGRSATSARRAHHYGRQQQLRCLVVPRGAATTTCTRRRHHDPLRGRRTALGLHRQGELRPICDCDGAPAGSVMTATRRRPADESDRACYTTCNGAAMPGTGGRPGDGAHHHRRRGGHRNGPA